MYQDYQDKDINFFYVYKSLAHPEINGFVAPHTLEERLQHIAEFRKITGSKIPWICDSMDNMFANAFGGAPNGEFVVGPDGKVLRQRFWSNPVTLRSDLTELIGAVDNPTSPAAALPHFKMPEREVASGVVPRIDLPQGLSPLIMKPLESEHPAYAKLHVEATRDLLKENKGQLYLGLYLDPLYKVHWNNRAGDILINVKVPEGMTISQSVFRGPQVKEDADIDPRQFLADLERIDTREPVEISVTYVVCDDAETFCHSITQSYQIEFRTERELGTRPGIFMVGMFAEVKDLDRNGDGKIEGDEFPKNQSSLYLSHLDLNLDNVIEMSEIDTFMSMFNNGRGFDSPYNDGSKRR